MDERLAALQLATMDPLDPKCMLTFRCMFSLFLSSSCLVCLCLPALSVVFFLLAIEASMKDIIGSRHPSKPKKDKKEKKRASSTMAPPPAPSSRSVGVTFCDPIVGVSVDDSRASGSKDLGKRLVEDPLPPSPK